MQRLIKRLSYIAPAIAPMRQKNKKYIAINSLIKKNDMTTM